MSKIAVVTDSNSGITQKQAEELGIHVIPMPFYIDGELYYEDINLSQEQFYQSLSEDSVVSTSQPTPADILMLWNRLLEEHDEIIHIPMSSSLSSSCETAMMLATEYEGKVQIVDNKRISVSQKESVLDAIAMVKRGRNAAKIKRLLEMQKLEASIYITVDTMKYLKKGGRVTSSAAAIGTVLNIKPVLQIHGDKLDILAKVRGLKSAKKCMLDAIDHDLNGQFIEKDVVLYIATSCSKDETMLWKKEVEARFPGYDVLVEPLSLSIACHIGPGAIGIGAVKLAR